MIQRLKPLLLVCCLSFYGLAIAETGKPAPQPAPKPQKTLEERYLEGQACVKQADTTCVEIALAGMSPNAPLTKILDAQLAAVQQDFDRVLHLLTPLQSNASLPPQASASLHATLAQAYEGQGNTLRALEQLNLGTGEDPDMLQQHIWRMLVGLPRETLLDLRGQAQDTLTQGWIDLAIAAGASNPAEALTQWRTAYPDHPVSDTLLQQFSQSASPAPSTDTLTGTVALLLPLNEPSLATVTEAIQAGLNAARGDASSAEIKTYTTTGKKEDIAALYQKAVSEGAQYVIGPLTREETTALAISGLKVLPTLALNAADQEKLPEHLTTFGLPVDAEAAQVARVARAHGMQSAIIIASDTPLAQRMEQAFLKEWKAQEATIVMQATVSAETDLAELKANLVGSTADMIFLAADAEQARQIRPYLNQAIPTFGTSHLYDGVALNPENSVLSAIHFVEMPWILNPDHPDFAAFREASAKLPAGEAQRWFAVAVDAWHILATQAAGKPLLLHGLSGSLHMEGTTLVRELPMAQFGIEGVELEQSR